MCSGEVSKVACYSAHIKFSFVSRHQYCGRHCFLLSLSVLIFSWTGSTNQVAFCSPCSSLSCLDVRSVSWTCSVWDPLCSDVQAPCLLLAVGVEELPSDCVRVLVQAYICLLPENGSLVLMWLFLLASSWSLAFHPGWEWKVECDVLWHPPFL